MSPRQRRLWRVFGYALAVLALSALGSAFLVFFYNWARLIQAVSDALHVPG